MPILVFIAAVAFAVAPFLSPEFGGFDPERFPVPQENPPVQPAGWAFAIWGVIYISLVLHAAVGWFRYAKEADWQRGRPYLFASFAVGAAWLPIALVSPIWATVLIWVMLITALLALYKSRRAKPQWIATWPVALYAGWLSAASFVSIGLVLAGYGIVDETTAAGIALVLATAFALVNQFALRLWPYGAAVAWGFAAIAVANLGQSMILSTVAGGAALVLLGLALLGLRKQVRV